MGVILPTAADWTPACLNDGLMWVDGRLCELQHPELWQGCIGAWSHALDSHPWGYTHNRNHLSRVGGVVDGPLHWTLDGSSGYLDGTLPLSVTTLVIEVWFRRNATGVSHRLTMMPDINSTPGDPWGTQLLFSTDTITWAVQDKSTSQFPSLAAGTVSDTKWHHVVAYFRKLNLDSSDFAIYLDGVSQSGSFDAGGYNSSLQVDSTLFAIGADTRPASPTSFFNGDIGEVRVYTQPIIPPPHPNAAYQCKPLRRVFAVSGGATFKAAWLQGRSRIYSGGPI